MHNQHTFLVRPSKHKSLAQCWSAVYSAGPTLEQHCQRLMFVGEAADLSLWFGFDKQLIVFSVMLQLPSYKHI